MRYSLPITLFILFTLTGGFSSLFGQGIKISAQPDTFLIDLARYLKPSKATTATTIADSFSTTFTNLDAANQNRVITIVRYMASNKMYKGAVSKFIVSQIAAQQKALTPEQNSRLLYASWHTLMQEPQLFQGFLSRVQTFCMTNSLVYLKKYKILTEQQVFSIDYVGGDPNLDTGAFAGMLSYKIPIDTALGSNTDPESDGLNTIPDQSSLDPVTGSVLVLKKANFTLITQYDSTQIRETDGFFLLNTGTWLGSGGKMDWTQAGMDAADAYITLGNYQWDTKKPGFTCDRGVLNYPKISPQKITGFYTWGTNKHLNGNDATYPQFTSYFSNFQWEGFSGGIKIVGGISLKGNHLSTENFYNSRSQFSCSNNGSTAFATSSYKYEVSDSIITTGLAKLVMYNNKDSVTHQGTSMRYKIGKRELHTETDASFFRETPYIDSFHKMEITCDEARYLLDSGLIQFRINSGAKYVPAIFQSSLYYNATIISMMKGLKNYDPLVALMGFKLKKNLDQFTIDDVANEFKFPMNLLEQTVVKLAGFNFINYDPVKRTITVLPKMVHYYKSRLKRVDFDYISMPSYAPDGLNAVLNVKTNDMKVAGVKKFYLSDSLGVYIIPDSGDITIQNNKNFKFNGRINAGAFIIAGKDFAFNYEKFMVKLSSIDSISLNVQEIKGQDSSIKAQMVANINKNLNKNIKLEHNRHADTVKKTTAGFLYINRPDNKAGLKKLKQYPILDVNDNAYVYFDREAVGGRIYDEKVRFEVPPFQIDSANTTDPKVLNFDGEFNSDGIFPKFKEKLSVQKDKSLGFIHKAPPSGYKLYNGKGKFFGAVVLNNKGISGKGEIRYLGAIIKSNNFKFYQDSVVADGKAFMLAPGTRDGVSFPDLRSSAWHMKWQPKADTMAITSRRNDLTLYENSTQLQGKIILQTTGVVGEGIVKREGVEITSQKFGFKEKDFLGRESKFIVLSNDSLNPSVRSTNVKFDFDLTTKIAEINPEVEGEAANEFPLLKYKTSIAKMVWDSQKKIITMSKPEDDDISTSYFYTTAKNQDSLSFLGTSATYNIEEKTLNIKGVPYLKVSDAQVMPDSGNLIVEADAKMRTLKNARVLLDTVNQYHSLDSAFIDVYGRYAFNGTANYRYPTPNGDTLKIRFTKFEQNYPTSRKGVIKKDKGITEGTGEVSENQPIPLASGISFKGNVKMVGSKPSLEFDGFVSLNTKVSTTKTWIPYVNRDNSPIKVDLKDAVDASNGRPIINGLMLPAVAAAGVSIYNNFVASKKDPNDLEIFTADGDLNYDGESKLFKIGAKDRSSGKTRAGNLITYSDTAGTVNYEGYFTLVHLDRVKKFVVNTSGVANGRIDSNNINMSVLQQYKISLPGNAVKTLEKTSVDYVKDGGMPEALTDEKSVLLTKIANLLGESAANNYDKATQTGLQPVAKILPVLADGIVFSNVDFKWNSQTQSFYSVGKLGLGNINKHNINASINGAIEIKKGAVGDIVSIYLEFGPDLWFYFNLSETLRMTAVSSDDDFNVEMSDKNQTPDIGTYSYGPTEATDKTNFLTEFFQKYQGIKYIDGAPYPGTETGSSDDGFGGGVDAVAEKIKARKEKKAAEEAKIAESKMSKKDKKKLKEAQDAAAEQEPNAEEGTKPAVIDPFAGIDSTSTQKEEVSTPVKVEKKSKKQLKAEAQAAQEAELKLQAKQDSIDAQNASSAPSTDPFGNVSEEKTKQAEKAVDSTALKAKVVQEAELAKEFKTKADADSVATKQKLIKEAEQTKVDDEAKKLSDAEDNKKKADADAKALKDVDEAKIKAAADSVAAKSKLLEEKKKAEEIIVKPTEEQKTDSEQQLKQQISEEDKKAKEKSEKEEADKKKADEEILKQIQEEEKNKATKEAEKKDTKEGN